MTIVILGAGRVGVLLARQLISENKEVIIIENDPVRVRNVSRQIDCMVIHDNGNSLEGLEKSGVKDADIFVALSESDEINMISCALVSSSFDKPQTIARVRNMDYSSTWDKQPGFLGIDHIINPEIEAAHAIVRAVDYGAVSSIVDFEESNLQMRSFSVEKDSFFEGKSVQKLRDELEISFIIAVVSRGNRSILPAGDTVLLESDQIWILAAKEDFKPILAAANKPEIYLESIVVAGGGNIGYYIARYLMRDNPAHQGKIKRLIKRMTGYRERKVHMIDRDYPRCKYLAEVLPGIQVTHADISEEQVLEEGRFNSYDLMITATGNHELNIIAAAYGRKAGINRCMALVKKSSTAALAQSLGIDVALSINEILVNSIQRIIRKKNMRNVYNFADSKLEMIEMSVASRPEMAGRAIKDIKLPGKTLIVMATRQGQHLIPNGNLVLQLEDYLMLITHKEHIGALE